VLLVANEFLDALPLRQLIRTAEGWREVVVVSEGERFVGVPGMRPMEAALPEARREQEVRSEDLTTTVSERFTFQIPDGGLVDLRLKYVGGVPTHAAGRARVRSAADPAILRVYHVDQLVYVVRDVPKGIDRVQDLRVDVTVPELRDLFDGSEQLISITVSPHYFRQVYGR